jgi:NitT/TauT family transport system substrate-binding protein
MSLRPITFSLAAATFLAGCGGASAPVSTPASPNAPAPASAKPAASIAAAASAKPASSAPASAKPAASGSAAAAGQLTPVKISNIGVSGGVQPLWIAVEGGIFKQNGLDVGSDTLTTSSAATVAALLSNQIQVGWTDGMSAVNARAGGGDVTVVATIHPAYSYLLETSADIKKPQDLKGKKLAVSSLTGTDAVATKLALANMGIDWRKDVTLVATGDNASRTAAVIGGSVQGTLQEPPGSLQLEEKGFHPLADLGPMNLPSVNASLNVSTAYLTQNRATVQKFVDSIVESIVRLKKDKPYAVSVLRKYYKNAFDEKVMGTVYDYYLPNTPTLPYPKTELFTAAIQELSKENPKIKDVDLNKVVDASFVKSAADRKLDQGV